MPPADPTTFLLSPEFWKFVGSLGTGGAIAMILFLFYRKDVRAFTELWKGQSDQLMKVVQDNTAATVQNTQLIALMYEYMQHTRDRDDDRGLGGGARLPDRRTNPR